MISHNQTTISLLYVARRRNLEVVTWQNDTVGRLIVHHVLTSLDEWEENELIMCTEALSYQVQ